jgi:thioredoxin-related protein
MIKNRNIWAILIILFLGNTSLLFAQDSQKPSGKAASIKWYSFEEAYKLNKKKPRKMVVDIYTEWCGWCKKMDSETFANPVIADYMSKNFYCVKLDAERKDTVIIDSTTFINPNPTNKRSAHQLAVDLLRGKMSYPSYVFLNEKGQMINVVPGFHTPSEFESILHYFGENAYEKLKWDEFKTGFQGTVK